MPTGPQPICTLCKHEVETDALDPGSRWACAAFPSGIPVDITLGTRIHTKPLAGDGGIQFERRDDVTAAEVDALLK